MEELPQGVGLTGGLAGDDAKFIETLICLDDDLDSHTITITGFYGSRLKVGYGSMDGFDPFGPERKVTKSEGNVLYTLDNQFALDLYKQYLGPEKSTNLTHNQFLFPLSYRTPEMNQPVVRTVLKVDEEQKSMTFAGDIPEGSLARLMKTNNFKLVEGAQNAANLASGNFQKLPPQLVLCVSCVGRKIIMKQRVDEEIEAVRETFGSESVITGFYSYGEIAHFNKFERCELHNQTMTITAFSEI